MESQKSKLRVSVDVVGMEIVQDLMKIMLNFCDDTRVPASVRDEFMDKVNVLLENR